MPKNLVPLARKLRKNQTPAEQKLWQAMRRKSISGFRFRRQVPMLGYIVDFACFDVRLIVEVDGATHSTDEELAHDQLREARLRAAGNTILRFHNAEIYENFEGVLETIWRRPDDLRAMSPPYLTIRPNRPCALDSPRILPFHRKHPNPDAHPHHQ